MSLPSHRLMFLLLLLVTLLAGCSEQKLETPVTLQGDIFGTFYQVTIADPITAERRDALEQGILDELEAVDASMSTYRDDAELVAFNKAPVGEWQTLSAPLIHVLDIARSVGEASDGAFDVTVGGLVNLWSFGPEARPEEVPEDSLIEQRLAEVGMDTLELDVETNRARRLKDVFVDLSGVAKGYATDQVAAYLADQGVENYLVNLGARSRWMAIAMPRAHPGASASKCLVMAARKPNMYCLWKTSRWPPRATTAIISRSTDTAIHIPSIPAPAARSSIVSPR
ncbi:thiamine biosynthesis lipoprotein ApbE precursor [Halomonas elongata]|uniref:FAD:protein FMN transferase n=1 Tax=Halomonas elongata TaxID=2746 RepID=A0A1B8NZ93_HALEL|nr:thiamine biosynthesis lipoprotein ApbE precursor [Halomonas elongata]